MTRPATAAVTPFTSSYGLSSTKSAPITCEKYRGAAGRGVVVVGGVGVIVVVVVVGVVVVVVVVGVVVVVAVVGSQEETEKEREKLKRITAWQLDVGTTR